jgi:hypothetical protein
MTPGDTFRESMLWTIELGHTRYSISRAQGKNIPTGYKNPAQWYVKHSPGKWICHDTPQSLHPDHPPRATAARYVPHTEWLQQAAR